MKKLFSILFALTLASYILPAQWRTRPLDHIHWYNPWTGSSNMAGLVETDILQGERDGISEAFVGASYGQGDFRNVFDPEKTIDGKIDVESYLKLKKVYLYGHFAFDYKYDWGNKWRGSVHPYDAPFMLADEVSGDISNENYVMRAGFGMPLGNWSIGADVRYEVGTMAKQKDLRNKNTDMMFNIAPSVTYKAGPVRLGLDFGYTLAQEKIEYTQIASNKENYLYYLRGIWLYSKYGYSSAETSRQNKSDKFNGNFNLDWRIGDKWRLYNSIGAQYRKLMQEETGYNNLRYGDVREWKVTESFQLQYKDRHRIFADFSMLRQNGNRYLQQEQLDERSGVRRYLTYGDPIPCSGTELMDGTLGYAFQNKFNWELRTAATYNKTKRVYYEYPFSFSQSFSSVEPSLSFSKYLKASKSRWELTPAISYRVTLDCIRNAVNNSGMTYETTGALQLSDPLNIEADFFGSNRLKADLGLCCDFWKMYVRADYAYVYSPELGSKRHLAKLTIGIAF